MSQANADEALKEIVELTRLYDVYGPLLSDHKKEIFESYVLDNYSLAEIAEQVGLSRQGVRDIVRRCSKELQEAEEKLGFLKKMDRLTERMEEIKAKSRDSEISEMLEKIVSDI
ncbi:MAG: DNA-binding protein [Lachnospiraceae bacterium]|nr:DNA-binding protein [Lachnospiraceae bacterium]